jgi:hypothetical protein
LLLTNFSVDLLLYFSAAPYARFMAIESSLAAGGSVAKSRVPDRVGENVPITAGNPKAAWSRHFVFDGPARTPMITVIP